MLISEVKHLLKCLLDIGISYVSRFTCPMGIAYFHSSVKECASQPLSSSSHVLVSITIYSELASTSVNFSIHSDTQSGLFHF